MKMAATTVCGKLGHLFVMRTKYVLINWCIGYLGSSAFPLSKQIFWIQTYFDTSPYYEYNSTLNIVEILIE